MQKTLEKVFKNQNIQLSSEKYNLFSLFFDILLEENKKTNLTRIVEKEDVAKKHFLDSVMSAKFIPKDSRVIDVGAGAGFPSIPLKILREDLDFTLVDSVTKKVGFLNKIIKSLNFKNTQAIHSRVEDLAQKREFRESFDVCVARAVAELSTLCEYCLPFLKEGGLFIAYKSADITDELNRAKEAIKVLGGELKEIYFYNLENDRRHCLVIISKVGRTPKQYPRRNNKPRLMPILGKGTQ